MQQIKSFLKSSGIKQAELADELGISRGYMSELANGDKSPGRELAVKIERVTRGAVPVASWSDTASPSGASQ
jgi:transcriptional regulator with XRE-family HTH domain